MASPATLDRATLESLGLLSPTVDAPPVGATPEVDPFTQQRTTMEGLFPAGVPSGRTEAEIAKERELDKQSRALWRGLNRKEIDPDLLAAIRKSQVPARSPSALDALYTILDAPARPIRAGVGALAGVKHPWDTKSYVDILKEKEILTGHRWAQRAVGMAADVLIDPMWFLGTGAAGGASKVMKQSKAIAKEMGMGEKAAGTFANAIRDEYKATKLTDYEFMQDVFLPRLGQSIESFGEMDKVAAKLKETISTGRKRQPLAREELQPMLNIPSGEGVLTTPVPSEELLRVAQGGLTRFKKPGPSVKPDPLAYLYEKSPYWKETRAGILKEEMPYNYHALDKAIKDQGPGLFLDKEGLRRGAVVKEYKAMMVDAAESLGQQKFSLGSVPGAKFDAPAFLALGAKYDKLVSLTHDASNLVQVRKLRQEVGALGSMAGDGGLAALRRVDDWIDSAEKWVAVAKNDKQAFVEAKRTWQEQEMIGKLEAAKLLGKEYQNLGRYGLTVGLPFTRKLTHEILAADQLPQTSRAIGDLSRKYLPFLHRASALSRPAYEILQRAGSKALAEMPEIKKLSQEMWGDLPKGLHEKLTHWAQEGFSEDARLAMGIANIPAVREFAIKFPAQMEALRQMELKLGLTVPEAKDYFPQVLKKDFTYRWRQIVNPEQVPMSWGPAGRVHSFFEKHKRFPTIEEGQKAGFSYALGAEAYEVRLLASEQARQFKTALDEVLVRFGKREVRDASLYKSYKTAAGQAYYLPKEWAQAVNELQGITQKETMSRILAATDLIWGIWKPLVTIWNVPGFMIRNVYGDTAKMMMGGASSTLPGRYAEALSILMKQKRAPEKLAKEWITVGGRKIRKDELVKESVQMGAVGPNTLAELSFFESGLAKKVVGGEFGPAQLNRTVESVTRLGGYMDALSRGMSPSAAGQWTRKYLFDYAELSDFERNVMRRVFPFYTWLRKNIPLMTEGIITTPGYYTGINKIREALAASFEGRTLVTENDLPDYLKGAEPTRVAAPSIRRLVGTPRGHEAYIGVMLPHLDLADLANASRNGWGGAVDYLVKKSPLFGMMDEIRTSSVQGRPTKWGDFTYGSFMRAGGPYSAQFMLAEWFGIGETDPNAATRIFRNLTGIQYNEVSPVKGRYRAIRRLATQQGYIEREGEKEEARLSPRLEQSQ